MYYGNHLNRRKLCDSPNEPLLNRLPPLSQFHPAFVQWHYLGWMFLPLFWPRLLCFLLLEPLNFWLRFFLRRLWVLFLGFFCKVMIIIDLLILAFKFHILRWHHNFFLGLVYFMRVSQVTFALVLFKIDLSYWRSQAYVILAHLSIHSKLEVVWLKSLHCCDPILSIKSKHLIDQVTYSAHLRTE